MTNYKVMQAIRHLVFSDKHGVCKATNQALSDITGLSSQTVSASVTDLERLGEVHVTITYGTRNGHPVSERLIFAPKNEWESVYRRTNLLTRGCFA